MKASDALSLVGSTLSLVALSFSFTPGLRGPATIQAVLGIATGIAGVASRGTAKDGGRFIGISAVLIGLLSLGLALNLSADFPY